MPRNHAVAKEHNVLVTFCWYLLTDRYCPDQTTLEDSEVRRGRNRVSARL